MPTNSFERKIKLTNLESIKKLLEIITNNTPKKVLSIQPYDETQRKKSEKLLKQCLARSRNKWKKEIGECIKK